MDQLDPFYIQENTLTDHSVIWEVYQKGSDQRLASAATEHQADDIAYRLNRLLRSWANSDPQNTIDA